MAAIQDPQQQLQTLVKQIRAESKEQDQLRARTLERAEQEGTERADAANAQLLDLGLSKSDLARNDASAANQQDEIERISAELSQDAPSGDLDVARVDVMGGLAPDGVQVLRPALSSVFSSSHLHSETQADAPASDWYYNGSEQNPWAWAQGAGSGLFGTGVGETSVEVDFWYYFVPSTARFYGINPYTYYRGFYIVKSDDSWYDSHYARAVVSSHVNVYQYNWKGWNSVNELDVGNDNINVNQRFDTLRNHYYSALLGANDGAWILNRVKFWVYARGGSAYSKLDFGTGTGNYVTAPYVYVS